MVRDSTDESTLQGKIRRTLRLFSQQTPPDVLDRIVDSLATIPNDEYLPTAVAPVIRTLDLEAGDLEDVVANIVSKIKKEKHSVTPNRW